MNPITFSPYKNLDSFKTRRVSTRVYTSVPLYQDDNKKNKNITKIGGIALTLALVTCFIKKLCLSGKSVLKDITHNIKTSDDLPIQDIKNPKTKTLMSIVKATAKKMKKDGGVIHPEELDRVLTKYVGENNVKEIRFFANPKKGIYEGRKKAYKTEEKDFFVLESHRNKKGIHVRFYKAISNTYQLEKPQRLYLDMNGRFKPKAYYSSNTHLLSDESALKWIRE